MGWWSEHVVPRVTDLALGNREVAELRRRTVASAVGEVVELGYGSALTLPHYPTAVTGVLAVEPSPLARRLATGREAESSIPVRHVGLDGASLPLPDDTADTVVSTFSLCTIPDLDGALTEVRRVLRPGGAFLFLEHGLSDDPATARWQHRLDGVQQRLFAGCHLTRAIVERVGGAGFDVQDVARERLPGPRLVNPVYRGRALVQAS